MMKTILTSSITGILAITLYAGSVSASETLSDNVVRIGILTDMTGPYSSIQGSGVVAAAKMAIEDFGGTINGNPIELKVADNKNDPDHSSSIARKWIDQDKIDLITGLGASSVALAIQSLTKDKDVLVIATGSGSTALTDSQCAKLGIRYTYSTRALAVGTAKAMMRDGPKSWYFLGVDYAFGKSMVKDATAIIDELNGKVVDSVYYPLGTTDFASYVLQAQQSKADIVALANAGADFVNSAKSFHEFGFTKDGAQTLVGMLVLRNDVEALGLDAAAGMQFTVPWFIDKDDASREWAKRYQEKTGTKPNWNNAGMYSAVMTYLKAVDEAGTDDPNIVREQLSRSKINDMFVENGYIQKNGAMVHDMYLVEVLDKSQVGDDRDILQYVETIPGSESFIKTEDTNCTY